MPLVADGLAVSLRTVWRWIANARAGGDLDGRPRSQFVVTDQLRQRLAHWRGNVAALHRELVEQAEATGESAPSRQALPRAVGRDVSRGDRAGAAAWRACPARP